MSKVWFISDEHYYHENIIKYTKRNFENAEYMNYALINNMSRIKETDTVWHLGDFALTNLENIKSILKQLPGKHNLIMGNHDKFKVKDYYETGFNFVSKYPILYDFFWLSHEPLFLEKNSCYMNLYGHLHHNLYISDFPNYLNICVERHQYKPITLDSIKKAINLYNINTKKYFQEFYESF
jgi:calcineurin-like phosphoesterase family protein